jgi:PKD repeat protein
MVGVVAATCDLTITGTVNPVPSSTVFAKETNPITITNVKNNGPDAAANIAVALFASDVSGTVPVASTTIASLASGGTITLNLVDPTVRNLEGGTVVYTATVDPDNLITETDETNNNKTSASKPVKYNGYKGKRYWEGGSDLTTKKIYDLNGGVVYSTQPETTAYKTVGWTSRTETWASTEFAGIPSSATIEKVWLFVSYNWDTTPGGVPNLVTTFNGNTITLGTPYTDKSNFGSYADYYYGLYSVDVTSQYSASGNTLVMTPGTGNSQALYPSTLVVIYSDPSKTRKQIIINEECDYLAYAESSYGTTTAEATAYAPFSGMTIDTTNVQSATLHSFVSGGGPNEGNLLFNSASMATNAWQGTSNTASAQVFDVKSRLTATGNEAGVQGTQSGGMLAIQQILVVEYATPPAPVADFSATPTSGNKPLNVVFTDSSSGSITTRAWEYKLHSGTTYTTFTLDGANSFSFPNAGIYDIQLNVTGPGGSNIKTRESYITVNEPVPAPVADFSADHTSGTSPLTVIFTATNTGGSVNTWDWDFGDSSTHGTTQVVTHTYTTATPQTYTVSLTATGPDYSDTETKTGYIQVGIATIEVSVGPSAVTFGTMSTSAPSTGTTQVTVTTSGGTGWSVTAADGKTTNKGHMVSGSTPLAGAFNLSNTGLTGSFQPLTSDFTDFVYGSGAGTTTKNADVKQEIAAADAPGNYAITITFTGAFS